METIDLLNEFDTEKVCEYRGRIFKVRDNGAILRMAKSNCKPSKLDNIWTFGKKDEKTGYLMFACNVRVHQVVATAFKGLPEDPKMVVDHIDTNRCNNRPDNLRWVTRLENALNNPITRKKIIFRCGSIEAFLDNPSILREGAIEQNLSWMRTVSKEEAAKCKRNVSRWAEEDSKAHSSGKGIGEWIFKDISPKESIPDEYSLKDSLTPGAKQLNWKTPTEFLLCPSEKKKSLDLYLANLQKGKVYSRTKYGDGGIVLDYGYNPKDDSIYVLTYKD